MKRKSMGKRILSAISALIMTLTMFSVPYGAYAEDNRTVYAVGYTSAGIISYYSIQDAWNAAQGNATIQMTADWNLDGIGTLELPEGKSAIICMNGKRLYRTDKDGRIFYLNKNASLYLYGYDNYRSKNNITMGFQFSRLTYDKSYTTEVYNVGGIVYGGYSSGGSGGGIYMEAGAKLELDHVAVAGNYSTYDGGGVYLDNDADYDGDFDIKLRNGAQICYNTANVSGGGIGVAGIIGGSRGIAIDMRGSQIHHNYALSNGGGIASFHSATSITMDSESAISDNGAGHFGGGIYQRGDQNTLKGGTVSGNKAADEGGGLYGNNSWGNTHEIEDVTFTGNSSTGGQGGGIYTDIDGTKINNCVFSGNTAAEEGGGIYMDGEASDISGSTFTGNTSASKGGGIFIGDKNVTIQNSEFTGNTASDGGGIYVDDSGCTLLNTTLTGNRVKEGDGEGGGIYVDSLYDIKLSGQIIIKNNYRANNAGNVDDLFLQDGWSSTAYIMGNPLSGSEIGIRTDASSGTRQVGKGSEFTENYFFSDVQNFYVNADRSDKKLNLKYNEGASYPVKVNGVLQGYYNATAVFTIDGASADENRVFKCWTEENGHEDILTMKTSVRATVDGTSSTKKHNFPLSFNAEYVTKISDVTLSVEKPVAGQALAETGTLTWIENGVTKQATVGVYWLVQSGTGSAQPVSGMADYGAKYSVAAKIDRNLEQNLVFRDNVSGKVLYSGGELQDPVKINVDAKGTLYIYGQQVETKKADITRVESAEVKIKKDSEKSVLTGALPKTAAVIAEDGNTYTVETDVEKAAGDILSVGTITQGGTVTIPLKITENDSVTNSNNLSLTVSVTVYTDGIAASPTATPDSGTFTQRDSDGNVTQTVTLSAEKEATIYYRVYESGCDDTVKGEFTEYTSGIKLSAAKGEKKTYVIEAKATKAGLENSTVATYTYTMDNPFTVTVTKTVKGTNEEYSLGTYTAKYYTGQKATLFAPVQSGYVFGKWSEATGADITGSETADTITVDPVTDDITATALYDPVLTVESLKITLTAPVANETLAGSVTEVTAVVSGKAADGKDTQTEMNMTKYIKDLSVTWDPSPESGKAEYKTIYKARFVLPEDESATKYASLKQVVVNDAITAEIKEEDENYVAYITFPITEGAEEPIKPDPEDPEEPINPDPTPYVPVPTPVTPVTPTTPDEGTVTVDYGECKRDSTCPIAAFTDADPTAWYHDGMHYCLSEGLINGVGDNKLSPEGKVTRGQIVTILWRLEGKPASKGTAAFSDIGDTWYTQAVRWAAENSIVTGYGDGKFGPDDYVTREQLAAILYRYGIYKGMTAVTLSENLTGYPDCDDVSTYAVSAMEWAVGSGIISGTEKGTLAPGNTATRGETAMMLQRFCTSI